MEDDSRSLIGHPDLLFLAFRALPFRYIGILAQVSREWREFANDTHWMRERVCFSYGSGRVNGHGQDLNAPALLELSMRDEIQSIVCGHRTTFFLGCRGIAYWVGESWSRNVPNAGMELTALLATLCRSLNPVQTSARCSSYRMTHGFGTSRARLPDTFSE